MIAGLRRAALAALLAAAASTPAQAQRADVVLYEHADFRGRAVTLGDDTPDLERLNFNDRAGSARIRRGTWQLCTDARYRGDCVTFRPGQYRDLGNANDRVSSARRLAEDRRGGSRDRDRDRDRDERRRGGRGDVDLYDGGRFVGYLGSLDAAATNFEALGFNDRVGSIVVHRGVWQFCTDAGFRGSCHIFAKGEHGAITAGDRYSSARPVPGLGGRPAAPPGRGGGGAGGDSRARIVLFDGAQFDGRSLLLDATAPNLEALGFNDRAESAIVSGGTWRLCSDAKQAGRCRDFPPGRYSVLPSELRSKVSSARLR